MVLAVSGNFSWVISDNQYDNHVGLCLIFPMSTYALDLELYFKRYRCLNPGMSLSKRQRETDYRVHLVDCFGLIRCWNLIINCIQTCGEFHVDASGVFVCYHCCHNFKVMKLLSSAAAVWLVRGELLPRRG